MIEVKNVSKKFKNVILFENLSVKFEDGKKILIKGANGTGKSVLLKMLVGYSRPNSGKIVADNYIIGKDVDFLPNAGLSINAPEFCNNWTGLENLLYLANIRKIASKEEIIKLCESLEIGNVLNKKYKTYSLGMKQKMRIVQAIMDKPKYIILDEPFDALDLKSQEKVLNILDNYVDENKLLIYTTHSMQHEKIADKIYEIENFRLIEKNKTIINEINKT